jgi:hypothetical protein
MSSYQTVRTGTAAMKPHSILGWAILFASLMMVAGYGCGKQETGEDSPARETGSSTSPQQNERESSATTDSSATSRRSDGWALAEPLTAGQYEQLGPRNDLDLTWLPSGGFFALVLHPSQMAALPFGPKWRQIFHQLTGEMLPFAADSLHRMVIGAKMIPLMTQTPEGRVGAYPGMSISLHFHEPIDPKSVLLALLADQATAEEFPAREHRSGVFYDLSRESVQPGVRFFLWIPDDRTAVLIKGDETLANDVLDGQSPDGPLAQRLARIDLTDREAAAVLTLEGRSTESAEPIAAMLQQIPESVTQGLLRNTRAARIALDLDAPEGGRLFQGEIEAVGQKEAIALNEYLHGLVASGQFGLASFESQMQGAGTPPEMLRGIVLAKTLLGNLKLSPAEQGVRLHLAKPPGFDAQLVAFMHYRMEAAQKNARIAVQHSQLKQLVLAMYLHAEKQGNLPAWAIASDQGQPLLSWRVALLPYLGQKELYDRFHLDEPWDSPHNRQLIAQMPSVFQSSDGSGEPGTTRYRIFVSEQTPFGQAKPLRVTDIVDTAQTVMIAAVAPQHATVWTRPDPLPFEPGESLDYFNDQMAMAMFDGRVVSQTAATSPFSQEQLDLMITGNVVSHEALISPNDPFQTNPSTGGATSRANSAPASPSGSSSSGSLRQSTPPPTAGNPFRNGHSSRPQ